MNIDAMAREIVERLQSTTDDFNVDDVAAALRAVRNEVLEKAANVAEAQKDMVEVPRSYEMAHVCIGMDMAAAAIRALKGEGT